MFAKWLEEYQKLSRKTRFISQLAAFLISVFSLLSLYDIARIVLYYEPRFLNGLTETEQFEFWISIFFQISIFVIFALRFSLLFSKKSKSFWLSQGLSFIGLIILAIYWLVSRPPYGFYELFPGEWIGFRYGSRSLDLYGLYYLLLSPLRKIITLITSIIKNFVKRKHKT